jgi:hypothetical protein
LKCYYDGVRLDSSADSVVTIFSAAEMKVSSDEANFVTHDHIDKADFVSGFQKFGALSA